MATNTHNSKIIKGLIWLVVIGLILYFLPGYGYQAQVEEETQALKKLKDTKIKWDKDYPPMHAAYFGELSTDEVAPPDGRPLLEVKNEYKADNINAQQAIEKLEGTSKIEFPDWTDIPEKNKREPGVYFAQTYEHKRFELENAWRLAGVECKDEKIGFDLKGNEIQSDENKAREFLRELYIAESIIRLCIKAKKRQEADELSHSVRPEAYMKIISVRPEPSVPAGPSELTWNKKYNKDEKNPTSDRFRKYNVRYWRNFIQEYPVEIMIQCDYNTFQRFLHSVRSPGQFLVIRSLEILSPFAEDSKVDRSEINSALQKSSPEGSKGSRPKEEQILVKISAAGMDFFDPDKFPFGLYMDQKEKPKGKKPRAMRGEQ